MTAPAAMPGEEEIAAIIDARAFDPTARWREGEPRDRRRRSAKQRARAILALFAARAGKEAPVELWRGERKVSIYSDVVIRVWGTNCASEMSDEPRTLDSVNAAVEWLFAPILAENERRIAKMKEALEPFADIAEIEEEVGREDPSDDRILVVQTHGCSLAELTVDDFRRVAAAIRAGE